MKIANVAPLVLALATASLSPVVADAADQTVLGRSIIVRNPSSPVKRKLKVVGTDKSSPNTIVGNPALSGATLRVLLEGANPTDATYPLPQGTDVTGKPFWTLLSSGDGYRYKDARGEQGAVKTLSIRASQTGQFTIKGSLHGKNGTLTNVPPNPGTEAWVTVTIGGGDRYCIQFGLDSIVTNKDGRLFKAKKATLEGCPASPSGAFLALD